MDQATRKELSPGIRSLVVWLNDLGFKTTDSGDGSNFKAGMTCASPEPMVAIKVDPDKLASEADRLLQIIEEKGVVFPVAFEGEDKPMIQASYNPKDGHAIIVLLNVVSRDVQLLPLFD